MFETEWKKFQKSAVAANLRPARLSDYQWQLLGGPLLVNYYPSTRTVYAAGAQKGTYAGIDEAIRVALGQARQVCAERTKRERLMSAKRRLLAQKPWCHYCRTALDGSTATIDHVIPLSRGGSNYANNLVLACVECNVKKGNSFKSYDVPNF